jgi:SLT domain-containing protein
LISQALRLAKQDVTPENIEAVNTIVEHESGWNPRAVNNWDSNAEAGTPSQGLMQTIGPTFDSYAVPGYKRILEPLDNLAAGISYAVDRYGSLQNVPGVVKVASGEDYVGY